MAQPPEDPPFHIVRGGSYMQKDKNRALLATYIQGALNPTVQGVTVGFRVALPSRKPIPQGWIP